MTKQRAKLSTKCKILPAETKSKCVKVDQKWCHKPQNKTKTCRFNISDMSCLNFRGVGRQISIFEKSLLSYFSLLPVFMLNYRKLIACWLQYSWEWSTWKQYLSSHLTLTRKWITKFPQLSLKLRGMSLFLIWAYEALLDYSFDQELQQMILALICTSIVKNWGPYSNLCDW